MSYEIVIPTSGRESLAALLDAIGPRDVIVVDDRRDRSQPLPLGTAAPSSGSAVPAPGPAVPAPGPPAPSPSSSGVAVRVIAGPARGPAAARNAGWRAARADWIVFLDDDVLPPAGWRGALEADLAAAGPDVAATQGRIVVPVPARPTDWERNVAGLEHARWATADMAYRRDVLAAVGGFDERFPRAYREDADLGLRVTAAGWRIVNGRRHVVHPVRPASPWISITKQAGNADDVLMRRLHGRDWRERAGVPRGRRRRHLATAAMGVGALIAGGMAARSEGTPRRGVVARVAPPRGRAAARLTAPRRAAARLTAPRITAPRRATARLAAAALGAGWVAGTAELAWARIAPGPRTPREVATMAATSVLMPFAAVAWSLRGLAGASGRRPRPLPAAVLFDRDGTLIADVPYNGDPARVEPMPGAREALARLRAAGVPVAVVSNQSGIARGLLAHEDVKAIHARMEELLGPLGPLEYCPHGPDDGCGCRKPAPGLIVRAAQRLGVDPRECVVVGDIGGDVEAARAAGADAVLIPTPRTRNEEIEAAPRRARDLTEAIDLLVPA